MEIVAASMESLKNIVLHSSSQPLAAGLLGMWVVCKRRGYNTVALHRVILLGILGILRNTLDVGA